MYGIPMEKWRSGIQFEIEFWQNWIETRGAQWPDRFREKFDPDTPLEVDRQYVRVPGSGEYFVLDVGAGPAIVRGAQNGVARATGRGNRPWKIAVAAGEADTGRR